MDVGDILSNSKSDRLILLIILLIVAFGIAAIVVLVAFNKEITQIMIAVYSALGLSGGGALYRNTKVDGPIRQQEALLQTAIQAKQEGVQVPVVDSMSKSVNTTGELQVWKPPEEKTK